jgi:calcineurin-like phosphoesterase family protein
MKRLTIALLVIVALSACTSTETTPTTTTTEAPRPVVIASVGDISCSSPMRLSGKHPCVDAEVASLVRGKQPDHLFLLGDIQYQSHTVKNFQENFGPIWADLIPIAKPIAGNHEYSEGGAKGYYATWTKYPKPGYYSFDVNNDWAVIAMNTNDECRFVYCDKGSDQYLWLESELQKNAGKCIIVMAHHPRYSSGVHGSSKFMKDSFDLMTQYGVDIFLSGHDHHYERFNTQPVQFVVGTGGKDLRRVRTTPVEGSVFLSNKHHGALFMSITNRTALVEFIDIDGLMIDWKTITC